MSTVTPSPRALRETFPAASRTPTTTPLLPSGSGSAGSTTTSVQPPSVPSDRWPSPSRRTCVRRSPPSASRPRRRRRGPRSSASSLAASAVSRIGATGAVTSISSSPALGSSERLPAPSVTLARTSCGPSASGIGSSSVQRPSGVTSNVVSEPPASPVPPFAPTLQARPSHRHRQRVVGAEHGRALDGRRPVVRRQARHARRGRRVGVDEQLAGTRIARDVAGPRRRARRAPRAARPAARRPAVSRASTCRRRPSPGDRHRPRSGDRRPSRRARTRRPQTRCRPRSASRRASPDWSRPGAGGAVRSTTREAVPFARLPAGSRRDGPARRAFPSSGLVGSASVQRPSGSTISTPVALGVRDAVDLDGAPQPPSRSGSVPRAPDVPRSSGAARRSGRRGATGVDDELVRARCRPRRSPPRPSASRPRRERPRTVAASAGTESVQGAVPRRRRAPPSPATWRTPVQRHDQRVSGTDHGHAGERRGGARRQGACRPSARGGADRSSTAFRPVPRARRLPLASTMRAVTTKVAPSGGAWAPSASGRPAARVLDDQPPLDAHDRRSSSPPCRPRPASAGRPTRMSISPSQLGGVDGPVVVRVLP